MNFCAVSQLLKIKIQKDCTFYDFKSPWPTVIGNQHFCNIAESAPGAPTAKYPLQRIDPKINLDMINVQYIVIIKLITFEI